MSLWNDFWGGVGDVFEDVGDVLENTWEGIKSNPIGAITSIAAMSMGIPPMWAGALGGGVGAAATGGDIIKGAFTGGAMGYMGAQAGAATGALGPIAQAAAIGATSAATGAILTGQDVLTAVKSGLILGTVSGGVAQLMTPSEAIAAVPKDQLAEIYAKGQDPLGDLIKQQGWTDSDSARAAASQVFSKNSATTLTQLQASVPDYVLKEAAAAAKTGVDTNSFIADKMGWADNGITASAASKALDSYVAANKVVNKFGPKEQAPVSDAVGKTPLEIKTNDIASTGLVNSTDAQVLAGGGYTAADVKSLVNAGYNAADLADMAATGVPASTLTSLANTQFTEAQINNLLTGHVSANNIADASNLINAGKLSVTAADSLLAKGVNTIDMKSIANSGKADAFAKLMDNGVSRSNAQYMLDKGVDLGKAATAIENGKLTGADLNNSVANNTYNKVITEASKVAPVAPAEVTPAPVAPAPAVVAPTVTAPPGTVDVGGGNFMDQQGNIVDSSGNVTKPAVTPSAPISQTASGYTPDQEAQYNNLVRQGMSPAEAVNHITNGVGTVTTDAIPVTGSAGFKGNETSVVPEYRTPNTDLASQAQIDNGTAQYNAGANAWEVPTQAAPEQPVVPVTPPAAQVPEITVTAPRIDTPVPQQPIVPIITPPTTVAPTPSVVQPPAPVAPQPPKTVVSSTTRTDIDGSVIRDDKMNDGTVTSVLIAGPAPTGGVTGGVGIGGTGGTGGTTDNIPTIEITAPKEPVAPVVTQPPLKEGPRVVIPETPPVTEIVVDEPVAPTEPTTPTDPNVPIVPIVPPTGPTTPTEDNYRGKYTWGNAPKVNIPTGLNPGWMAPQPFYQNTTPAQAQYYWGSHPYQPGPTFNSQLYNTVPSAPATPWGATNAARAATSQEILAKMGNYYPSLGNTGPVRP